jgi:hypothetical protein
MIEPRFCMPPESLKGSDLESRQLHVAMYFAPPPRVELCWPRIFSAVDVLDQGEPGKKVAVLRDKPDIRVDRRNLASFVAQLSLVGQRDPRDDLEQGAFAAAARANECGKGTLLHRQGHIFDSQNRLAFGMVGLGNVGKLDDWVHGITR